LGKNSRFKIFKGAIRIFVTPKNEGIGIILPEVNKENERWIFFKSSFTLSLPTGKL
jgi:hypothetical protein